MTVRKTKPEIPEPRNNFWWTDQGERIEQLEKECKELRERLERLERRYGA
jgi:hypothetical protein